MESVRLLNLVIRIRIVILGSPYVALVPELSERAHAVALDGKTFCARNLTTASSDTVLGLVCSAGVVYSNSTPVCARTSVSSNEHVASWAELYLLRDEPGASRAGPILSPSYANNLAELAAHLDRLT